MGRPWFSAFGVAVIASLCMVGAAGGARASSCPDLALVLAIDASGSINDRDFATQIKGYANAFRSPSVQSAIRSAGDVEVGVVLWADPEMRPQVYPFQSAGTVEGAERIASYIEGIPRKVTGNTGIGRGLWAALDLLDDEASCAVRRVVNVSGDGKETLAPSRRQQITLSAARARAKQMGVTVNALAIETEIPDLERWFKAYLITGQGSFSMQVDQFAAFGVAIEKKLGREISLPLLASTDDLPLAPMPNGQSDAAVDASLMPH